jgi:hypothetical protein
VDKVHFILEKKKENLSALFTPTHAPPHTPHYSADDVDDDDNNSHHSAAVLLLRLGISTSNDRTVGERERERVAIGVFVVVVCKQEFRYL